MSGMLYKTNIPPTHYCIHKSCKIKINLHSLLRYLCTLGLPFMAAILTGLGLGKSLTDAELIDMDSLPRRNLLTPLPENEISDSVPK